MNTLGFIASVVGSLAIPVTVTAALLIFRAPLTDLLGRVTSYEGMGQKMSFAQKLAGAEEAVDKADDEMTGRRPFGAIRERVPGGGSPLRPENPHEPALRQLARIAQDRPSFAITQAWEELSGALTELVKDVNPEADVRNPVYRLSDLAEDGIVNKSFPEAVMDLFELRATVNDGRHDPTPDEAAVYVESARRLTWIAVTATAQRKDLRYNLTSEEEGLTDLLAEETKKLAETDDPEAKARLEAKIRSHQDALDNVRERLWKLGVKDPLERSGRSFVT